MLRLTRRSEYGIIAIAHLAQRPGEAASARDIAERYGIPKRLLAEVMKQLSHRGFVRSSRGASGGYQLAVDPTRTSVRVVLAALEGPFEMVQCATDGARALEDGEAGRAVAPAASSHFAQNTLCELLGSCPIRGPVQRIHDRMRLVLEEFTIRDLISGGDGAVPMTAGLSTAFAPPAVAAAVRKS
ncbi:MAG: Rrf2 family transcriptional regulator [Planctomycetes bacterium]|nr:Rrf2 family transcriptional regulator [Planctomycetota bacterium]